MFVRVLELPMTASDAHKSPAISFNELYSISYSHQPSESSLVGLILIILVERGSGQLLNRGQRIDKIGKNRLNRRK
jgi:hypothetical protein